MSFDNYQDYADYQNKMIEVKNKLRRQEDQLPFIDFLRSQLSKVQYWPSSDIDSDYKEASDIIYRIIERTEKEPERNLLHSPWTELYHLKLTERILENFKGSDTNKRNVIKDFKKEIYKDLGYMIRDRENNEDGGVA
jgi:hypothetical protein